VTAPCVLDGSIWGGEFRATIGLGMRRTLDRLRVHRTSICRAASRRVKMHLDPLSSTGSAPKVAPGVRARGPRRAGGPSTGAPSHERSGGERQRLQSPRASSATHVRTRRRADCRARLGEREAGCRLLRNAMNAWSRGSSRPPHTRSSPRCGPIRAGVPRDASRLDQTVPVPRRGPDRWLVPGRPDYVRGAIAWMGWWPGGVGVVIFGGVRCRG